MKYQIFVSGAADEQVFDNLEDAVNVASSIWNLTREQRNKLLSGETIWVEDNYDPDGVLIWVEGVED